MTNHETSYSNAPSETCNPMHPNDSLELTRLQNLQQQTDCAGRHADQSSVFRQQVMIEFFKNSNLAYREETGKIQGQLDSISLKLR